MRDLYKQLHLEESAPAEAIQSACSQAQPDVRPVAEFILLDEHLRRVYDRNRNLLTTVGQLRARLGLSLSPFWTRGAFADFTFDPLLKYPSAQTTHEGQHLADPLEVLRAFDGARRRKRRRPKAHYFLIGLAVIILLATLTALIFLWWQSGQNVTL